MARGYTKWNEEREAQFLGTLAKTGLIGVSCKAAGISQACEKMRRDQDEDWARRFNEAMQDYNESLEQEIHRRGVEGYDEPIYQNGQLVGHRRRYSDRLLEMQAKSRMKKYQEKAVDIGIEAGGVLVVGGLAANTDEWLKEVNDDSPDRTED